MSSIMSRLLLVVIMLGTAPYYLDAMKRAKRATAQGSKANARLKKILQDAHAQKIQEVAEVTQDILDDRLREACTADIHEFCDSRSRTSHTGWGFSRKIIEIPADNPSIINISTQTIPIDQTGPELLKSLLEQGANPNAFNDQDENALHRAVKHPDVAIAIEMVKILLAYGADAGQRNYLGETPYSYVNGRSRNLFVDRQRNRERTQELLDLLCF